MKGEETIGALSVTTPGMPRLPAATDDQRRRNRRSPATPSPEQTPHFPLHTAVQSVSVRAANQINCLNHFALNTSILTRQPNELSSCSANQLPIPTANPKGGDIFQECTSIHALVVIKITWTTVQTRKQVHRCIGPVITHSLAYTLLKQVSGNEFALKVCSCKPDRPRTHPNTVTTRSHNTTPPVHVHQENQLISYQKGSPTWYTII